MKKLTTNLCLIAPIQPAFCDAYRRVLHLLEGSRKSVNVIIISRGLDLLPEETNWTIAKSLIDLDLGEREPDMYLCWDLLAINELLSKTPCQPVIYGVTVYGILQGVLPVHSRIMGYLFDTLFLRSILVSCGIPLNRQFSLAAGIATEDDFTSRLPSSKRNGVLVITDNATFSSTVATACEILGMQLERLPYAMCAHGISSEFYARYSCVIAAGQPALQAAAAGTAVIIADEKGSAGLLTQENLPRILDAHAGPACFESPIGTEIFMSALKDSQMVDADVLAQQLCLSHSESARAHQFNVWLRQTHKDTETIIPGQGNSAGGLQLRSIGPMPDAVSWRVDMALDKVSQKSNNSSSLSLSTELLVECTTPVKVVSQPCLPLNQYIAANEENTLTGFFVEGWSHDEPGGRWTDGSKATIQFETDAMDESIELLLHLRTFLPLGLLFQRVIVSINSHPLLCWRLNDAMCSTPFRLPLNPEYLEGKSKYQINFDLPDASSPQTWGKKDVRMLGLWLAGFELLKVS